jgi:hypothetical protein
METPKAVGEVPSEVTQLIVEPKNNTVHSKSGRSSPVQKRNREQKHSKHRLAAQADNSWEKRRRSHKKVLMEDADSGHSYGEVKVVRPDRFFYRNFNPKLTFVCDAGTDTHIVWSTIKNVFVDDPLWFILKKVGVEPHRLEPVYVDLRSGSFNRLSVRQKLEQLTFLKIVSSKTTADDVYAIMELNDVSLLNKLKTYKLQSVVDMDFSFYNKEFLERELQVDLSNLKEKKITVDFKHKPALKSKSTKILPKPEPVTPKVQNINLPLEHENQSPAYNPDSVDDSAPKVVVNTKSPIKLDEVMREVVYESSSVKGKELLNAQEVAVEEATVRRSKRPKSSSVSRKLKGARKILSKKLKKKKENKKVAATSEESSIPAASHDDSSSPLLQGYTKEQSRDIQYVTMLLEKEFYWQEKYLPRFVRLENMMTPKYVNFRIGKEDVRLDKHINANLYHDKPLYGIVVWTQQKILSLCGYRLCCIPFSKWEVTLKISFELAAQMLSFDNYNENMSYSLMRTKFASCAANTATINIDRRFPLFGYHIVGDTVTFSENVALQSFYEKGRVLFREGPKLLGGKEVKDTAHGRSPSNPSGFSNLVLICVYYPTLAILCVVVGLEILCALRFLFVAVSLLCQFLTSKTSYQSSQVLRTGLLDALPPLTYLASGILSGLYNVGVKLIFNLLVPVLWSTLKVGFRTLRTLVHGSQSFVKFLRNSYSSSEIITLSEVESLISTDSLRTNQMMSTNTHESLTLVMTGIKRLLGPFSTLLKDIFSPISLSSLSTPPSQSGVEN